MLVTVPPPPQEIAAQKTVFEMNSEAVFLLQKRQYKEAICKLLHVVERMQNRSLEGFRLEPTMSGYGSQCDNEVVHDVSLLTVPATAQNLLQGAPQPGHNGVAHQDQDKLAPVYEDEDGAFSFYDQAFVTVFLNYQGRRGERLVWAMVLYNLALCFHHRAHVGRHQVESGLQGTRNSVAKNLIKAANFYQMARQVVEGHHGDGRPEDTLMLLLAVNNNLGHIYENYFCMIPETQQCVDHLRRLLASETAHYMQNTSPGTYAQHLSFFLITAVATPREVFSYAPSA